MKSVLSLHLVGSVLAIAGTVSAQFQPNQPAAAFHLDGMTGSTASALTVVRGPCQPVVATFDSVSRLRGQPMFVVSSPRAIVAAGHGAWRTAGGQLLNLDVGSAFVLPTVFRGPMRQQVRMPNGTHASLQFAILDPAAPDGVRLSAPGHVSVSDAVVVVARPSVLNSMPGRLMQFDRSGRSSPLSEAGDTPSGILFDPQGTVYFGRARFTGGFHVELFERSPAGAERSLGVVVDTRGGAYFLASQGFDLAWLGREIVFGHPTVLGSNHQIRTRGCIRAIDPVTGKVRTIVDGLDRPSGLAADGAGNLYFGEVTGHPVRYDLHHRDAQGRVRKVTTLVDTTNYSIQVGLWSFDLALDGARLAFNVPSMWHNNGSTRPGRIGSYDLQTGRRQKLVDGLNNPTGLSFDGRGGLYFADVYFAPSRARLFHREANGKVDDLGQIFSCGVGQVALGGWGLDVVVPCR